MDGFAIMEADAVLFGNRIQIWAGREEAGYVVKPLEGDAPGETYRTEDPKLMALLRNFMHLMQEQGGLPPVPVVEEEPALDDLCQICGGYGVWLDDDLNEHDCTECRL